MTKLKAYAVSATGGETADLVYAYTASQARVLGLKNDESCCGADFIDVRAKRAPDVDGLAQKDEPYVEYSAEIHRRAGFTCDGETPCDSCGLSALDMVEYQVCQDCWQCPECGCDC